MQESIGVTVFFFFYFIQDNSLYVFEPPEQDVLLDWPPTYSLPMGMVSISLKTSLESETSSSFGPQVACLPACILLPTCR